MVLEDGEVSALGSALAVERGGLVGAVQLALLEALDIPRWVSAWNC